MSGFPRFATGGFDTAVGHAAPPSLHLQSQGRSVAYSYVGPETVVRSSSDYRIEAFVRTSGMEHARACLSACFLDVSGQPLFDSLERSEWLEGSDKDEPWRRVELFLASAPAEAATISLQIWILQDSMLGFDSGSRPIQHADVHAEAWLDDVAIFTSPRVEVTTEVPGNVIGPDDPQALRVSLGEQGDGKSGADFTIADATGKIVLRRHLASDETTVPEFRISLGDLPAGLYQAHLEENVESGDKINRVLTFARLAPPVRKDEAHSHSFGIVMDSDSTVPLDAEIHLLQRQGVRAVKMPIWHDPDANQEAEVTRLSRLVKELARRGYGLTAMLCGSLAPGGVEEPICGPNLLLALKENTNEWREMISSFASTNASTFRFWQLGSDEFEITSSRDRFVTGCESVRKSLAEFIPTPQLTATVAIDEEPGPSALPIAQPTLRVAPYETPENIGSAVRQQHSLGFERISAYVPPLSEHGYLRTPRIAEWASRVISTLHAGVDTVFVPQTWHRRMTTTEETIIEPTEEFVVLRSIAQILDGAKPGPAIKMPDETHILAFEFGDSYVLALWNPNAPNDGREVQLQLGKANREIDLWEQISTLPRDEKGRQILKLTPVPVFVDGVDRILVDLMSGVAIEPKRFGLEKNVVRQSMVIDYKGMRSLSGRAVIHGPPSVAITPREFDIRLSPGRKETYDFEARYDQNELAGTKEFSVELRLDPEGYQLELPLTCEVQMPGLEVKGEAFVQNDNLVLRHILRNTTTSEVNFRGMASVPGRERQSKPFLHVFPGETQIVEYRFPDGAPLVGRSVRLGLREMNDGPRMHNIELVVP